MATFFIDALRPLPAVALAQAGLLPLLRQKGTLPGTIA